ncbi:MAG: hypothetical protein ABI605_02110 [Rhizobacter sp.]
MSFATATSSTSTRPAQRGTSRHEVLRDALLSTVDLLTRRRADQIDETYIDNYVALGWLEWHGGLLRLSTLGSNICAQMSERAAALDS